jgi:hypothetical protein
MNDHSNTTALQFFEPEYTQFLRDFKDAQNTNMPFEELLKSLLNDHHVNSIIFSEKTTFDPAVYRRVQRQGYIPKMKTLITICFAFNFSHHVAATLLASLGRTFNRRSKIHHAYFHVLVYHRGKTVHEVNEVLKSFGVDAKHLLGVNTAA